MSIKILYEDNHLLMVEKPVNMPVQADASRDLDLLTALKQMIKVRDQKPGNVYLALVHRLDRPVGGAMVFAKTSKAASRLSKALRQHQVHRHYLGVVMGEVQEPTGILRDYLWKDRQRNQVYRVEASQAGSQYAELSYQTLAQAQGMTLVQLALKTGRPHQIRVQLQGLGHPLYGDQKYGDPRVRPGTQLALWAYELQVPHPTRGQRVQVHSWPPDQAPWQSFGQAIPDQVPKIDPIDS